VTDRSDKRRAAARYPGSGRSRYRFEGLLAGGRTDQDVADAPPVHVVKLLTNYLARGKRCLLWVDCICWCINDGNPTQGNLDELSMCISE